MVIVAIPQPTEESEKRLEFLEEKKLKEGLTDQEKNEIFNLSMRQFWDCEC